VTKRGTLSKLLLIYNTFDLFRPYTYCGQERGALSKPIHLQYCTFDLFRPYTYCDQEGDTELATFALTDDDLVYKIPFIQRAQAMSDREVFCIKSH
jgi:hypothetical protein